MNDHIQMFGIQDSQVQQINSLSSLHMSEHFTPGLINSKPRL